MRKHGVELLSQLLPDKKGDDSLRWGEMPCSAAASTATAKTRTDCFDQTKG